MVKKGNIILQYELFIIDLDPTRKSKYSTLKKQIINQTIDGRINQRCPKKNYESGIFGLNGG